MTDLDDTFLAQDKSIPETNLAALDALAHRGVAFVPCTGRPIDAIPEVLATHPATRYLVGANGAAIADASSKELLHRQAMPIELVDRIYERVRSLDVTFDAFVGNRVLVERVRYDRLGSYGIDEHSLRTVRKLREPHDATIPELLTAYDGVDKVTLYWGDLATRDRLRAALSEFAEVDVTSSHAKNFEFMAAGTSKGSALVWICQALGCETSDAVAFGDSANDAPMLQAAGDGVAVANATADARSVADHVCAASSDAGVGRYLLDLLA